MKDRNSKGIWRIFSLALSTTFGMSFEFVDGGDGRVAVYIFDGLPSRRTFWHIVSDQQLRYKGGRLHGQRSNTVIPRRHFNSIAPLKKFH